MQISRRLCLGRALLPIRILLLIFVALMPSLLPAQDARKEPTMERGTRYRTVQIAGLSVFYREAGPKDGPTLLLLHGLPSSSRMFEPLFARLSGHYHLVAPDYPGFGQATGPTRKNSPIHSITSLKS